MTLKCCRRTLGICEICKSYVFQLMCFKNSLYIGECVAGASWQRFDLLAEGSWRTESSAWAAYSRQSTDNFATWNWWIKSGLFCAARFYKNGVRRTLESGRPETSAARGQQSLGGAHFGAAGTRRGPAPRLPNVWNIQIVANYAKLHAESRLFLKPISVSSLYGRQLAAGTAPPPKNSDKAKKVSRHQSHPGC